MVMAQDLKGILALVGVHTVWVLLPLIPAILIYRLFPSTSVAVSGPLSGLTVRASGAFAAYLTVFILGCWAFLDPTRRMIGSFERPFWTVSGHVKLVDPDGQEITSEDLADKIKVHLDPDFFNARHYSFHFKIAQPDQGMFPFVIVDIPDFGKGSIDLSSVDSKVTKNNYEKTIEISEPIVVHQEHTAPGQARRARPEDLPDLGADVGWRSGNNPPRPLISR